MTWQCRAVCRDRHSPRATSCMAWYNQEDIHSYGHAEGTRSCPSPTTLLSHEGEGQKSPIFNSSVAHFHISLCHYNRITAAVPAPTEIDSLVLGLDPSDG